MFTYIYISSGKNFSITNIDLVLFDILGCSYKPLQHKTVNLQATKCSNVEVIGNVVACDNPVISYGSVGGGIPKKSSTVDYNHWCTEMGFGSFYGVLVNTEEISKPYGWVYGCNDHDDSNWHWCDASDGVWLEDGELGFSRNQFPFDRVKTLECKKGNAVPECTSGKTSDSGHIIQYFAYVQFNWRKFTYNDAILLYFISN